jgi:hypothetical protein
MYIKSLRNKGIIWYIRQIVYCLFFESKLKEVRKDTNPFSLTLSVNVSLSAISMERDNEREKYRNKFYSNIILNNLNTNIYADFLQ